MLDIGTLGLVGYILSVPAYARNVLFLAVGLAGIVGAVLAATTREDAYEAGNRQNKWVGLVDDSIVRGTTSVKIVEMVRNAGAREVHLRISSPPTTHSCFYGIDTPDREELLASTRSIEQMASFIGVDTLAYISINGLYRAVGEAGRDPIKPQFCDACFTGDYPIRLTDQIDAESAERQLSLLEE